MNYRQVLGVVLGFWVLGGITAAGISCARSTEGAPVIPPLTNPLSRDCIGFGVVNVSYTHVIDQPRQGAASLGYLRRGSVVRIVERHYVINQGNRETWVLAEEEREEPARGWLPEAVMNVYDNYAKARTASKFITP